MSIPSTSISGKDNLVQLVMLAIATRRVIQIRVQAHWRTLEPYVLSKQKRNRKVLILYAYCRDIVQTEQHPSRWQRFRMDEIEQAELTLYMFCPHMEYVKPKDLL